MLVSSNRFWSCSLLPSFRQFAGWGMTPCLVVVHVTMLGGKLKSPVMILWDVLLLLRYWSMMCSATSNSSLVVSGGRYTVIIPRSRMGCFVIRISHVPFEKDLIFSDRIFGDVSRRQPPDFCFRPTVVSLSARCSVYPGKLLRTYASK